MIELSSPAALRDSTEGSALMLWAAQGFGSGVRAWAHRRAVVVSSPGLSARDRLAVWGPPEDAVPLVRQALAAIGPSYRPLGDAGLIEAVLAELPELTHAGRFSWMTLTAPALPGGPALADWLSAAELREAAALLDAYFPTSHAHPSRPGATAWAGVRDAAGRLTAVAADAWSSPEVGFLAAVTAHPAHGRGHGHAAAACRLVLGTQLRRCGRAALMVDDWNAPALRLYTRLGFERRAVAAAAASQ